MKHAVELVVSEDLKDEHSAWFVGDRVAEIISVTGARLGFVITVEQTPLQPLAMGHYKTVISVRRAIDHLGEAAKRGGYEVCSGCGKVPEKCQGHYVVGEVQQ